MMVSCGKLLLKLREVMSDDVTISKLRAAAEDGNAKAALTLGEIYMKGEETPRNEQEALRWFMRAAQLKETIVEGGKTDPPRRGGRGFPAVL